MKKRHIFLLIGLMLFAASAFSQCPSGQQPNNSKWTFTYTQCFSDTVVVSYCSANNIAFIDANKNLTYITDAQLKARLGYLVPADTVTLLASKAWVLAQGYLTGSDIPSGDQSIVFINGTDLNTSNQLKFDYSNNYFFLLNNAGDTLFKVDGTNNEALLPNRTKLKNFPDSGAVLSSTTNGAITSDSINFRYFGGKLYLGKELASAVTSTAKLVISGGNSLPVSQQMFAFGNINSAIPSIELMKARGTVTAPNALQGTIGRYSFGGYDGTNWIRLSSYIESGAIQANPWTATTAGSYLQFTVTNVEKQFRNALFINPTVNGSSVSIGTGSSTLDTLYGLTNYQTSYFRDTVTIAAIKKCLPPSVTGTAAPTIDETVLTLNTSGNPIIHKTSIINTASGSSTKAFSYLAGAAGSTELLSLDLTGLLNCSGPIVTSQSLRVGANQYFSWNNLTRMRTNVDGDLMLTNNAQNGFGTLQFGGVTSSFPGIRRSGTILQVRLADNSAYTNLEAGQTSINSAAVASAALSVTSTTQGFLPPRMTATQASAITSPAEGLMVYVTDTNGTFTSKGWWGYNGAAWEKLNN